MTETATPITGTPVGNKYNQVRLRGRFFPGLIVSNTKERAYYVVLGVKGDESDYAVYLKNIFFSGKEATIETKSAFELIDDRNWTHENFRVIETTRIDSAHVKPERRFQFRTETMSHDTAGRIEALISSEVVLKDIIDPRVKWTDGHEIVQIDFLAGTYSSGGKHRIIPKHHRIWPLTWLNKNWPIAAFLTVYGMVDYD